jgi:uncharacterized protein (TIGR00725 family)
MGSRQEEWLEYARPLGIWIAEAGHHLLTGGGAGVMASVSAAFVSVQPRAGAAIGIIPTDTKSTGAYELKPGYPNPYVEIAIVTPLGGYAEGQPGQVNRNHVNILTSDVIIALPGNHGTKNEVSLAIRFGKPILLFGPADAFASFELAAPRTQSLAEVQRFVASH